MAKSFPWLERVGRQNSKVVPEMDNNININPEKTDDYRMDKELNLTEKKLLSAAAAGDISTVNDLLIHGDGNVNVNCTDTLGRSAVELAVDADHLEVAEVLLHYGAKPGEALMYAVDKEDMATVQALLRYSTKGDKSPSAAFPPEVTPIVLASHKNCLPIIKSLVDQGRLIADPDVLKAGHITGDSALNLYRGLASPYYLLVAYDDPLNRAFLLSTRLEEVGADNPEVEEMYTEMAEGCRSLGVDLLDQVRTRDEAAAILNCGDDVTPLIHGDDCQMKLSRLDMAIDHEQKKFVANRWSQRLVSECWYGPYFRPTTMLSQYARAFLLMLLTPILALTYLLAPMTRAGRFVRTPAVRFAMYLASVLVFVIMVLLRAEKVGYTGPKGGQLGPPGSALEWVIMVWIFGMLLEEARLIVKLGPRSPLNSLGISTWLIIIIYLVAFFLRIASYIEHGGPSNLVRFKWPAYDSTLIAEVLTSIGGVLSILRLLSILTIDRFLGPLALSMGCMIKDIVKFLIIFFIIVIAFTAGLNELYSFYGKAIDDLCSVPSTNFTSPLTATTCSTSNAFAEFQSSFEELFWSLFGLGSKDTLNLEINVKANVAGDLNEHTLTMYIGYSLYGLYLVTASVVLLNMLIAMMSNSYQHIADNETIEWRFEVTKMMLRYIRDDTTLPVPFNLLPNPKFIYNKIITKCCLKNRYESDLHCKLQARAENNRRYKEVLPRLVRRYLLIHEREKGVEPIFANFTPYDPVTKPSRTSVKIEPDGMPVGTAEPSKRPDSGSPSDPGQDVAPSQDSVWAKVQILPGQEDENGDNTDL